jgi:hypothetical protein
MKLQPSYMSPFSERFEPISRREAAQIIGQWRRYENGTVHRKARKDGAVRAYTFNDWRNAAGAAMVLRADA